MPLEKYLLITNCINKKFIYLIKHVRIVNVRNIFKLLFCHLKADWSRLFSLAISKYSIILVK